MPNPNSSIEKDNKSNENKHDTSKDSKASAKSGSSSKRRPPSRPSKEKLDQLKKDSSSNSKGRDKLGGPSSESLETQRSLTASDSEKRPANQESIQSLMDKEKVSTQPKSIQQGPSTQPAPADAKINQKSQLRELFDSKPSTCLLPATKHCKTSSGSTTGTYTSTSNTSDSSDARPPLNQEFSSSPSSSCASLVSLSSLTSPVSPKSKDPIGHGSIKFDTAMLPSEPPPPIPRVATPFPRDVISPPSIPITAKARPRDQPGLPAKATAGFNQSVGPVISLRLRRSHGLKKEAEASQVSVDKAKVEDKEELSAEKVVEKNNIKEIETVKLQSHRDAKETIESPLKEDAKNAPPLDVNSLIYNLMNSVTSDEKDNMIVADHLTEPGLIEQIIVRAIESFKKLPSMLRLKSPMYIVGDIHGQFTDLLRIFALCGNPSETFYLFLGDYVDRGPHSLEVICLLLLLRIRYPWRIFMLRGNHECSAVNRTYGFSDECENRFQHIPVNTTVWGVKAADMKGTQVWYRFQDVFNWLPFCALINERILCMHGGLSPNLERIEQLEALKRPVDPCEAGLPIDLLWADPDTKLPCGETEPQYGPSNRGISSHFSQRAVMEACRNLNLDMVVRAHQVVQDGYEFFAHRHLVTLFSAPNYCGQYNNAGAVMSVDANLMISFKQLKPVGGTPCRKKVKSTEINFDDIDLDALCSEDEKSKAEE